LEIKDLTTFELSAKFEQLESTIAILPIGSIEQHGSFLPLSTDSIIAKGVSQIIDNEFHGNCFVYPAVNFSNADACANYLGTMTISHDVFRSLVRELLQNLIRNKFDYILVVNGHGINEGSINEIVFELNLSQRRNSGKYSSLIYPIHVYKYFELIQSQYGIEIDKHAGWMENVFVETFVEDSELKAKYDLYSQRAKKEKNATLPINESKILGEFVENRSKKGVIGNSLPEQHFNKEQREMMVHDACSVIVEDVRRYITQV